MRPVRVGREALSSVAAQQLSLAAPGLLWSLSEIFWSAGTIGFAPCPLWSVAPSYRHLLPAEAWDSLEGCPGWRVLSMCSRWSAI